MRARWAAWWSSTRGGRPVYLRSVADVREDFGETSSYVSHREGRGAAEAAVTIAVAKRKGANATDVTHAVLRARGAGEGAAAAVERSSLAVTRDYGETAGEKARELILHLIIATLERHRADLALPGLARGGGGAGGRARHARPDAVRLLRAGLHAQSHHAVRADLLDRHPGGRRDRGGGEHLPAHARWATGRRRWRRWRPWTKSATRRSSPRSR